MARHKRRSPLGKFPFRDNDTRWVSLIGEHLQYLRSSPFSTLFMLVHSQEKKKKNDGSLSKSDIHTKRFDQLHSWFFLFYNFQLSTEEIQVSRRGICDLLYYLNPIK